MNVWAKLKGTVMGLAKRIIPEETVILLPQLQPEKLEETYSLVAVYGNDKMGLCRHYHLGKMPKFLGKGRTKKKYMMQGVGLPFIFKSPSIAPISVEVYEIPTRILETSMDQLHGFFKKSPKKVKSAFLAYREEVDINLTDGGKCKAWMYISDNRWKKDEETRPNTVEGFEWLGVPILP